MAKKKRIRECAYHKRKVRYEPRGLEVQILQTLARKEKSWSSEISRETNFTLRAARLALRRLLQERMIRYAGEEEYGAKYYELTTYGLFMAFYYQEQCPLPEKLDFPLWKYLNEVAQIHGKKIPFILEKWDFFKDKGITHIVCESLQDFFADPNMPVTLFYRERGEPEEILKTLGVDSFQTHEETLVKKLTQQILFSKPTPSLVPKENGQRTLILMQDSYLKEYINNEIKSREEFHEAELNKLRSWKGYFKEA